MSAGYSKTPLLNKLGIKPGFSIYLQNPPHDYQQTLGALPDNVALSKRILGNHDFIQFFTTSRAELEDNFKLLSEKIKPNGMLWISWPKKTAKVQTDLNENIVREIGLKNNLVDVKVCAVDEVWSGLKFVYRLKDRQ